MTIIHSKKYFFKRGRIAHPKAKLAKMSVGTGNNVAKVGISSNSPSLFGWKENKISEETVAFKL